MDLQELRSKIDEVDKELIRLFNERMNISADIAKFKQKEGLPIYNPERERNKLYDMALQTDEQIRLYGTSLYSFLFDLSKSYQRKITNTGCELTEKFTRATENIKNIFPSQAVVACQGVEGAYSQIACEKLFSLSNIMYCATFDNVFNAIEQGLCKYGVLPIENSTAGSINQVYDLLMKHDFTISRSVRLKINHSLLAKKGVKLSDIKEIFSHEQAITQCASYLKNLGIKVTACENTAIAAKLAAESPRSDIAALSSRSCAELYGLDVLASSVQDKENNYTRFICVSKELELYAGANKTSIMVSITHKPGALFSILSKIYTLGVNLTKLESRPMPGSDFEFMFYFDLETPVYSPELIQLLEELRACCDEFKYLGSYSEVI